MRMRTALNLLLVATSAASVAACGGKTGGDEKPGGTGVSRASLTRAANCDDLLSMLQADAVVKENTRIDAMIAEMERWSGPNKGAMPPRADSPVVGAPSGEAGGDASFDDSDAESGGNSGGASDFSRTNTQVDGVDEADIVKTDGKRIYLVHGARFFLLDAWPAENLAEKSSVAIEGEPIEMFVEENRALVYSSVNGDPIYAAAGVEPRGRFGYGYGYDDGYGVPGGDPDIGMTEPAPAPGMDLPESASGMGADYPGGYPGSPYGTTRLLKVTVLDLGGAEPKAVAEHWFEGEYLSSRRMGAKIRTVLNGGDHGPVLQSYPNGIGGNEGVAALQAAFEQLRHANLAKIGATTLADWLPYQMRREGSSIVASSPACESFYVPTAGTTEHGLVQVKSLDWTAPSEVGGVSIVGRADRVYANEGAMYLAASAWDNIYVQEAWVALPNDQSISVSANRTHVHKLDLTTNPNEPVYIASGTIPGTVLDQFSMDERSGKLRIATTEDRMWLSKAQSQWQDDGNSVGIGDTPVASPPQDMDGGSSEPGFPGEEPPPLPKPEPSERIGKQSQALEERPPSRVNRLFVLDTQGDELVTIGDVGELAPEERIFSTRFVGDKGYVVTFRQVDPLFVVDLSNPAAPKVLGELEIPGFSNYMHPIDDGHLLTIGRDQGVTNGLAVQLFDVTEPTNPKLQSKYVFSAPWGSSEAEYNHKAFTWYPSRKLLAFPYVGFDNMGAWSSLELISVDAAKGSSAVAPFGSIDHSAFFDDSPHGYCGGYYGLSVRRGIFLDDVVYSISYGGVMAHDLADLEAPIASLPLSAPTSSHYACGFEG